MKKITVARKATPNVRGIYHLIDAAGARYVWANTKRDVQRGIYEVVADRDLPYDLKENSGK